jgi:DNA-binding MarR family transcriptional regulator
VELVRSFNRFYTRQIGLLREGLLDTTFSLTQARGLYELSRQPGIQPAKLAEELGLDRVYLSRLLKGFESKGLITRAHSEHDGSVQNIRLDSKGRSEFGRLVKEEGHHSFGRDLTGQFWELPL